MARSMDFRTIDVAGSANRGRAEQKPESGCARDSDVAMDVRLGSAIREGGYTVAVGMVAELLN
jgi:translation elongation factor EF-Tu-like GTPase